MARFRMNNLVEEVRTRLGGMPKTIDAIGDSVRGAIGGQYDSYSNVVKPLTKNLRNDVKPIINYIDPRKYQAERVNPQLGNQKLKAAIPAVGKTAWNAFSLSRLSPGLVLSSGALGAGISKLTGNNPQEGFKKGLETAPTLAGIGSFTNPLISRYGQKVAQNVRLSPITKRIGQEGVNRVTQGVMNIPEGVIMNKGLGYKNYSLEDAALDFGTGVVFAGQNRPRAKGTYGRRPSTMHPEDVGDMDRAIDAFRTGSDETRKRAKSVLYTLADRYLGKNERPESGDIKTIIKQLQNKAGEQMGYSNLALGIKEQPKIKLTSQQQQAKEKLPKIMYESRESKILNKSSFNKQMQEANRSLKEQHNLKTQKQYNKKLEDFNKMMDQEKKRFSSKTPDDYPPDPRIVKSQFDQIAQEWRNRDLTSQSIADQEFSIGRFKDFQGENAYKLIKFVENPTEDQAKKLKVDFDTYSKAAKKLRGVYDNFSREAEQRGIRGGYLQNYINHVWKESPKEIFDMIDERARGIGKNPSFIKERRIPTYEEGIAFGLTPKYTHPDQLIAHYRQQLEKAVAAKDFVEMLQKSDIITDATEAPFGWKVIDAPFIPDLNGKFAPRKVADDLTNMFGQAPDNWLSSVVGFGSKLSKTWQDVTLSGGIRTLNAFSLGNMIKEFTAGRFIGPIKTFGISFSERASNKYFNKPENLNALKALRSGGIPSYTSNNYQSAYKNIADSKPLRQIFGDFWSKNINEPTFRRFLPMMQVEFYKDALKSGMTEKEAMNATKQFYGVIDNFKNNKVAENTISTIFFAPKFRESMINFWINNAKSLNPKNYGNKAFDANRKFLAGTVLTYLMYSALNKATTGHWMHENKDGKEFAIEIPRGNGRSWFIPMLPSVGTVPRRALEMAGELKGGDIAGATQKAGSFFSQPISLGSQLLTNKTFYGGPIYQDDDSVTSKLGKLVGYGVEQSSHPFLGEPIAVAQGRKTPLEAGMGMLELPVYPSKSSDTAHLRGTAHKKYQELLGSNPQEAERYRKIKLLPTAEKLGVESTRSNQTDQKQGLFDRFFGGKSVEAKEADIQTLPQTTDELSVLYEEAENIVNSYEDKKTKINYSNQYVAERERQEDLFDLDQKYERAKDILGRIEKERPEQVFEIELGSIKNKNVEERADWVVKQLNNLEETSDKNTIHPLIRKYFPKDQWNTAQAVMMAESGGKTGAKGDDYPINGLHAPSYGLFQIRALEGRPDPKILLDPEENVKFAANLWKEQGWQPWSAYTNGNYKQFLGVNFSERDNLINRLWDEGILTSKSNGVAQYIEDNYGINVWNYTGKDTSGKKGKGKKKIKKITKLTLPKVSPVKLSPINIKFTMPKTPSKSKKKLTLSNKSRTMRIKV